MAFPLTVQHIQGAHHEKSEQHVHAAYSGRTKHLERTGAHQCRSQSHSPRTAPRKEAESHHHHRNGGECRGKAAQKLRDMTAIEPPEQRYAPCEHRRLVWYVGTETHRQYPVALIEHGDCDNGLTRFPFGCKQRFRQKRYKSDDEKPCQKQGFPSCCTLVDYRS